MTGSKECPHAHFQLFHFGDRRSRLSSREVEHHVCRVLLVSVYIYFDLMGYRLVLEFLAAFASACYHSAKHV
jgi:hypothetical protein